MGSLNNILLLIIIILLLYFLFTYKSPKDLYLDLQIKDGIYKEPFISDMKRYYNSNIRRPLRLQKSKILDKFRKHTNTIHKNIR
jgi:hypothetical protein